jgi:hypothetical protein
LGRKADMTRIPATRRVALSPREFAGVNSMEIRL